MFNFDRVFIIHNPAGTWSFVGAVPVELRKPRKPTQSDIMAGRVQADGWVYSSKCFETKEEALRAVQSLADKGNVLARRCLESENAK